MSSRNQANERIAMQARQDAVKYTDVNDACPWPFGSGSAIVYKREFLAAREIIEGKAPIPASPTCTCQGRTFSAWEEMDNICFQCSKPITAPPAGVPGMEVTELDAEDVLCGCGNELTMQELDTGKCQGCGKAVIA